MSDEPEESAYYLRLLSMYIDLGTETLLDVFVHHSPGKNPEKFLHSQEETLIKLKNTRILNKQACDLLLKEEATIDNFSLKIPLDLKKFDITLLITLSINLFSEQQLPPPMKGWDQPPRNNDKSIAADLLRLRTIRNVIVGHHPKARLPKWRFDKEWNEVSEILLRILHGMDPEKEKHIKERIEAYRLQTLVPNVKDKYDVKLREWHEEVSKLQAEVEDLIEKVKGFDSYFTNKCDRYEKYIALLVKGGRFVLSAFLDKEVKMDGRDLCNILDDNKDTFRGVLTSKQVDVLYPSTKGSTQLDPSTWDVGLLAIVILNIFGNTISRLARKSVECIGESSQDYPDKALIALDGNKFEKTSTELKTRLLILSEYIDEETLNKCEVILDECKASDSFQTNMDMLETQGTMMKSFTDIHKETLQRTKKCLQEMITNGISFGQNHELDLKMITLGTDEEKKKFAEEVLTYIWKEALDRSEETEYFPEVKKEVVKILEEIKKGKNPESFSIQLACIILRISCTSPSEMLRIIHYFESCRFQEAIGNIAEELGYYFNTAFAVFTVIPIDSLWGILNLRRVPTHAQEFGIRLSISVSSPADMLQLKSLVSNEKIIKSTQSISAALSKQLAGKITVKAEADMKELENIFVSDLASSETTIYSRQRDRPDEESSVLEEPSHSAMYEASLEEPRHGKFVYKAEGSSEMYYRRQRDRPGVESRVLKEPRHSGMYGASFEEPRHDKYVYKDEASSEMYYRKQRDRPGVESRVLKEPRHSGMYEASFEEPRHDKFVYKAEGSSEMYHRRQRDRPGVESRVFKEPRHSGMYEASFEEPTHGKYVYKDEASSEMYYRKQRERTGVESRVLKEPRHSGMYEASFEEPTHGKVFNRERNIFPKGEFMADAENWTSSMEKYKDRLLDNFDKNDVTGVHNFVTQSLDQWRIIPLNVAVTGNSGVGKSSFINTIRGKLSDDEDAADVDVVSCTEKPTPYQYSAQNNLVFWDLPGIGTYNFNRNNYLENVKFERYDCFIIISASRFTENDLWLANTIKKKNEDATKVDRKFFYFVRTKVDVDLATFKKGHRNTFSDGETLQRIRTYIKQELTKEGFPEAPLFLVENYEHHRYDFEHLIDKLVQETLVEKRESMALSLTLFTESIIDRKYEALKQRMWKVCLASATGGTVPIPGFSILVDEALLVKEVKAYRDQLGLNEENLRRTASLLEIPFEDLQDNLELESNGFAITIRGLMTVFAGAAFSEYLENVAKFIIPIVGAIIAGGVSYHSTKYILIKALESAVRDAKKLNKRIFKMLNEDRHRS